MKSSPSNIKSLQLILLSILVLLSSCGESFTRLTVREDKYKLTMEADLENNSYSEKIEAFYANGEEGYYTGEADIQIYYQIFLHPNSEKAILISSGRTEAAIKYKELIFDLFNNGYSIYIYDHRGQGLSDRMTEDPDMGYVDDFQFYINDMKEFYDDFVKPNSYNKTYLLAHSMGGAIGMTYLEQYPDDFTAAAFSSPMLGLSPPICKLVKDFVTEEPKYALGQSKYKDDKSSFKGNTLTRSQIRYNRMIDAFDDVPKARLGGATYNWVYKSCQQFEYMFNNIDKIETPFIVFSAEKEKIVNPKSHIKFISAATELDKVCMGYEIGKARHELLIEEDEERVLTINKTLDFFSKH